jgi:hypothetical protein
VLLVPVFEFRARLSVVSLSQTKTVVWSAPADQDFMVCFSAHVVWVLSRGCALPLPALETGPEPKVTHMTHFGYVSRGLGDYTWNIFTTSRVLSFHCNTEY